MEDVMPAKTPAHQLPVFRELEALLGTDLASPQRTLEAAVDTIRQLHRELARLQPLKEAARRQATAAIAAEQTLQKLQDDQGLVSLPQPGSDARQVLEALLLQLSLGELQLQQESQRLINER